MDKISDALSKLRHEFEEMNRENNESKNKDNDMSILNEQQERGWLDSERDLGHNFSKQIAKSLRSKRKGQLTFAILLLLLATSPTILIHAKAQQNRAPNGLPRHCAPNDNDALPYVR